MTQEEKAKAYDEAIKKAIDFKNNPFAGYYGTDLISSLFPKLKESKDENIIKDIIWCLKHSGIKENDSISPYVTTTVKNAIAWLEKQNSNVDNANKEYWRGYREGKKEILDKYAELEKKGESYTKRDVDDAYLKGVTDTKNEIEKQYEASYQIRKDIATFIFNYRGDIKDRAKWMDYLGIKVSFVKKQGEQKPDKVEPKFKVGDKIQYLKGCGTIMTIEKIENGEYIFANNLGHTTIEDGNKWYLVEHNPTWSEEDEKIFRSLSKALARISSNTRTDSTSINYSFFTEIDWLKSLKNKFNILNK